MTMFTKSPTKLRLFNKIYKSVATFLLFLTTTFVEKLWQSLILYIFVVFTSTVLFCGDNGGIRSVVDEDGSNFFGEEIVEVAKVVDGSVKG